MTDSRHSDAPAQPAPENKADSVAQNLHNAAFLEVGGGYTAKQAIAVEDNSNAVGKMFPGDQERKDAAYRIIMHDMKMDGYPNISESDAKMFTPDQRQAIDQYTKDYKPSMDTAKVDAEAKELAKLGFPTPSTGGHHSPSSGGGDHSAQPHGTADHAAPPPPGSDKKG